MDCSHSANVNLQLTVHVARPQACHSTWNDYNTSQIAIYVRRGVEAEQLVEDAQRRFNIDLTQAAPQLQVRDTSPHLPQRHLNLFRLSILTEDSSETAACAMQAHATSCKPMPTYSGAITAALHFTALHCTSLHFTALHCTALCCHPRACCFRSATRGSRCCCKRLARCGWGMRRCASWCPR